MGVSKPEKSCCTNIADMFIQTEVRRDGDTKNTDVLVGSDSIFSKTQTWTVTIK